MAAEFYSIRGVPDVPNVPTAVLLPDKTIGLVANSKLYRSGKRIDGTQKVERTYDQIQRIASDMLGVLELTGLECNEFTLARPDGGAMLNMFTQAVLSYRNEAMLEWHTERNTPGANKKLEQTLAVFTPDDDHAGHGHEEIDEEHVQVEQILGSIHHLDQATFRQHTLPKLTSRELRAVEPFPATPISFPLLALQRTILANFSQDNSFVSAPAEVLQLNALEQGIDPEQVAVLIAENMSQSIVQVAKEASQYGRRQ